MGTFWVVAAWLVGAVFVSCLALGVVRAAIRTYFREKRAYLKELMGARDADDE